MNFKRFLSIVENIQDNDNGMADIMNQSTFVPQISIGLPTITKTGKISMLIRDKNPIMIQLDDGTRLFFSHDQYKRISGNPERNRHMTVVFQRDPSDKSNLPAQIVSCTVT